LILLAGRFLTYRSLIRHPAPTATAECIRTERAFRRKDFGEISKRLELKFRLIAEVR
jgi:hypothetical protein